MYNPVSSAAQCMHSCYFKQPHFDRLTYYERITKLSDA